ncbi:MAG TPA: glycoside hydrolase family 20 zincin-like fold domain-containing protein, partial [Puia sp.]|nr:glycoside hydrolase family 20 zincin-like fold domain-containing protein [Puia sp.]
MTRLLVVLLTATIGIPGFSQGPSTALNLIPEPVSQQLTGGRFTLPSTIVVEAPNLPELGHTLEELKTRLSAPTGYTVTFTHEGNAAATIRLILNRTADATLGAEGYTLTSTPTGVTIRANKPAGIFYGLQTLYQILPNEIENSQPAKGVEWSAPCVTITDYPRFGWRGLMLDVARHYQPISAVKRTLDDMEGLKFNVLHLHLSDDQGFRVESNKFPKLQEDGSDGNYYTQADIRD